MMREFLEDKQQEDYTMFSKLHHQNPNTTTKFHHHNSAATDETAPDEIQNSDSRRNAAFPAPNDGATIEVVRRPRGRPPGSKNKPKPPVIIQRDSAEPTMSPYVLELPPGVDIVESTAAFCRKRNMGLCVLNGKGVVSNVTLKQPSTTPGATVTFHGRFDILSISVTILPSPVAANVPFALTLAGPQGQVVGGHVVGPLVSAGTIYLVGANFSNPSYHRLKELDNDQDDSAVDGGLDDSPKSASGAAPATSGGVSMYSYQSGDVIWAPSNRQQSPF